MKKLAMIALVCSVTLLASCGKKETTSSSSSSTQTKQTSQSTTATSTKASEEKATEAATSSSAIASSGADSASQSNQATDNQATEVDGGALLNGDFSTIAGTWQNDLGESIEINRSGTFRKTSMSGEIGTGSISMGSVEEQVLFGNIPNTGGVGGAAFIVILAGIPNPHYHQVEAEDRNFNEVESVERILIGQDINADAHPYYRVGN